LVVQSASNLSRTMPMWTTTTMLWTMAKTMPTKTMGAPTPMTTNLTTMMATGSFCGASAVRPPCPGGAAGRGQQQGRRRRSRPRDRRSGQEYLLDKGSAHEAELAYRHGGAYSSWCISFLSATDASDTAPWPSFWLLGMAREPRRWNACEVREAVQRRLDNFGNCLLRPERPCAGWTS
jgi:hypothetical protein